MYVVAFQEWHEKEPETKWLEFYIGRVSGSMGYKFGLLYRAERFSRKADAKRIARKIIGANVYKIQGDEQVILMP